MLKTLKNGYLAQKVEYVVVPLARLMDQIQRDQDIRKETREDWASQLVLMLEFGTQLLSLTHGAPGCYGEPIKRMSKEGFSAYYDWVENLKAQADWTYSQCRRCARQIETYHKFCGECGLEVETDGHPHREIVGGEENA